MPLVCARILTLASYQDSLPRAQVFEGRGMTPGNYCLGICIIIM